jgi:DNA-binding SARP family transcriptional activator
VAERLRFEVLGPVRAWRDGAEIDLGSPQQRAILAILLLQAGTPASPDQLISAIWGGAAPPAAVGVIRSYVSRAAPGPAGCGDRVRRRRLRAAGLATRLDHRRRDAAARQAGAGFPGHATGM